MAEGLHGASPASPRRRRPLSLSTQKSSGDDDDDESNSTETSSPGTPRGDKLSKLIGPPDEKLKGPPYSADGHSCSWGPVTVRNVAAMPPPRMLMSWVAAALTMATGYLIRAVSSPANSGLMWGVPRLELYAAVIALTVLTCLIDPSSRRWPSEAPGLELCGACPGFVAAGAKHCCE